MRPATVLSCVQTIALIGWTLVAASAVQAVPADDSSAPPVHGAAASIAAFRAVECTARGFCLGATRDGVWRSTDWGASWSDSFAGSDDMVVNGVACSSRVCIAYGGYAGPISITQTGGWIATSSDDGLSFGEPADQSYPVWAASCGSSRCTAISREDDLLSPDHVILRSEGIADIWTGYSFDKIGISPARVELKDVACASESVCVAVGADWDPIIRLTFASLRPTYTKACGLLDSACWTEMKAVDCFGTTCVGVGWNGHTDRPVGGRILVSNSSGRTWVTRARYKTAVLTDASCVSAKICVAVGRAGLTLRTTDSGRTWTRVTSPTRSFLWSVSCLPTGQCVAAGDDGSVIYSGTSGSAWRLRSVFQGN